MGINYKNNNQLGAKMKYLLAIVGVCLLTACAAPSPQAQRCIDSTPKMSAARWSCLQDANSRANASQAAQRPAQQAPAYDPFRAPTIVNTGPGTTSGNTNYELNGAYKGQPQNRNTTRNCVTQFYGGVANTTCN
jgi:hypothetical protein